MADTKTGPMTWDSIKNSLGFGGIDNFFDPGGLFQPPPNPADNAMPYLDQIAGMLPQYFQPWINAGQQALPTLQQQYEQLLNNPGAMVNNIGADFQQSPGYQFQTQQALNAANRAAAAGGTLGTPMHQQNAATVVNGLANQDYYNWLNRAMGMYGMGVQGQGNLANMGYGASSALGENLANALQSQAQLAYSGQADQNQGRFGMLGQAGGLIGGIIGALI